MTSYCGYIALVGRPNVGKSTLLNRLIGQKLSITSRKPQTTRQAIRGVETQGEYQFIYVDTPGIHPSKKSLIHKLMNKAAYASLQSVDLIVFIVQALQWRSEDEWVLRAIIEAGSPCILVANKIDGISDKKLLLPWLEAIGQKHHFSALIPLSAKTGIQVEELEHKLKDLLPEGEHVFAADELTDRSAKFLSAELLREKIFRLTGQEVPYSSCVEIESFKEEASLIRIHALIWVDKPAHKQIIIGDKGKKLKEIATAARLDMERLLGQKVFLRCYCKVKSGWADDQRLLQHFGLNQD